MRNSFNRCKAELGVQLAIKAVRMIPSVTEYSAKQFWTKRGFAMSEHSGGCLCGDLRYKVMGNPEIGAVCHCRYCQLRTGSAFGTLAYFKDENVKITAGKGKEYSFTSESGTQWETVFCDTCATTVFIKLEVRAGLTGVTAGTLDPPTFWFELDREAFTRSKAHFVGDIIAKDTHETIVYYDPKIEEPKRRKGG